MPTSNQELLDAINDAMKGILTGGAVVQYAIGERSLRRADLGQLLAWRQEVKAGIIPAGGLRLHVQFEPACEAGGDDDL